MHRDKNLTRPLQDFHTLLSLSWCHWEIKWHVLCRGNRCELFSHRQLKTSQSALLGATGGFQKINGGPESWRNRVTYWEGIKGRRALCLKSSWAGGKDVSQSWAPQGNLQGLRSWDSTCGSQHGTSVRHTWRDPWNKSQILEAVPAFFIPASWLTLQDNRMKNDVLVRCWGPSHLQDHSLQLMEERNWCHFYIISQGEKTEVESLQGFIEWSCVLVFPVVPVYACCSQCNN